MAEEYVCQAVAVHKAATVYMRAHPRHTAL